MMERKSELRVEDVPVDRIRPNPWNVNKVPDHLFHKLREYIRKEGLIEPLVVRPAEDGVYELIGGEHRWRVAKELGWSHVPCAIVELDDRRAKVASVNLNSLHGEAVPSLLGELIHDLSRDLSMEDLATMLPWDASELVDLTDLLRIPDGLEAELLAEAERAERERPRVLAIAVTPEQEAAVEKALGAAQEEIGASSRGAALTYLATTFLNREVTP